MGNRRRLCYVQGMAETHSVHALRTKSDEIRAIIRKYEALLRRAQNDLAHVNAALKIFAATRKPEDYPSYVDLTRVFRRGETTNMCLEALRTEGALDTRALTLRVMRSRGLDETDTVLRNAVAFRVIHAMRRQAVRGIIVATAKKNRAFIWKISTPTQQ
jgi:hypothetical protein